MSTAFRESDNSNSPEYQVLRAKEWLCVECGKGGVIYLESKQAHITPNLRWHEGAIDRCLSSIFNLCFVDQGEYLVMHTKRGNSSYWQIINRPDYLFSVYVLALTCYKVNVLYSFGQWVYVLRKTTDPDNGTISEPFDMPQQAMLAALESLGL